jgi:hypothetical protein
MTEAPPTRTWNDLVIPTPGTYELDEAHKRIGFLAMHMMVSPVRGEFATGSATIEVADDPLRSSVTATIDAASINTLNADRDTHLKSPDFLDVENHPTLEFRSTGIEWRTQADPIFSWAALKGRSPGRSTNLKPAARTSAKFVLRPRHLRLQRDGGLRAREVRPAVERRARGRRRARRQDRAHRARGRGDPPGLSGLPVPSVG